MKHSIYDTKGKKAGDIDLSEEVFNAPFNKDLIHQVIVSMTSNQREVIAHTKGRSEVKGGGQKPWKQKGTGRARHGSIRSPIWRGGGITFGPTSEKNYSKKINKKMKARALFSILSQKLRDEEIIFVQDLDVAEGKTKNAREVLKALSTIKGAETLATKRKNSALVTNTELQENNIRAFGNIASVHLEELRKINPLDILTYKYLVVVNPTESVELLANKINN